MRLPKNNVRKNRLLDRFIDGKKYTCDEGNFEEYGYQFFKQFFIVEITFPDFFCHQRVFLITSIRFQRNFVFWSFFL